jgi:imidazolonepropionase-like amidohydrolase
MRDMVTRAAELSRIRGVDTLVRMSDGAIVGATLFRPYRTPLEDATIVYRGGRIESVGSGPAPPDLTVFDGRGRWVLPGLIDAHIHFFQSGGLYTRPDIIDLRSRVPYDEERRRIRESLDGTFRRYVASGVTAVADCGGPFWNFEVREMAARAEAAPHVAITGPLVSTFGPRALQPDDPPILQCDTPAQARDLVRRQLGRRPDYIKIWYILLNRPPESLLPVVVAAADEAHRAGLRVAAHATELETARAALRAGADILVHSVFDRPVDDGLIELMRRTIYIPTLMVVERYRQTLSHTLRLTPAEFRLADPHVLGTLFDRFENLARGAAPEGAANLKRVHGAGVTVAAGTDAGNIGTPHGPAIFRELELMVEAGLAPSEALTCATLHGAKMMGREREIGSIEPGKRADMVVLRADPTRDIRNVSSIDRIVLGGRAWRQDELIRESAADVVQRQLNGYNARELELFLETYSDDVVIVRDGREALRGKAAMRERYGRLFEEYPNNHASITRREVDGDVVTDDELVTGRPGGEIRARARYEVEGGLIRRVTFFT